MSGQREQHVPPLSRLFRIPQNGLERSVQRIDNSGGRNSKNHFWAAVEARLNVRVDAFVVEATRAEINFGLPSVISFVFFLTALIRQSACLELHSCAIGDLSSDDMVRAPAV